MNRFEMFGIGGQFSFERGTRRRGQLRRRPLHHRKDRPFPIECLLELIIPLAPIEIGRDQRVDVGVDREVPGRIEAPGNRKDKCDQDSEKGKPRASFDNRNDSTCQHNFSFWCSRLPETPAVYRSSTTRPNGVFLRGFSS